MTQHRRCRYFIKIIPQLGNRKLSMAKTCSCFFLIQSTCKWFFGKNFRDCLRYFTLRFCHTLRASFEKQWNPWNGFPTFLRNRASTSKLFIFVQFFTYISEHGEAHYSRSTFAIQSHCFWNRQDLPKSQGAEYLYFGGHFWTRKKPVEGRAPRKIGASFRDANIRRPFWCDRIEAISKPAAPRSFSTQSDHNRCFFPIGYLCQQLEIFWLRRRVGLQSISKIERIDFGCRENQCN